MTAAPPHVQFSPVSGTRNFPFGPLVSLRSGIVSAIQIATRHPDDPPIWIVRTRFATPGDAGGPQRAAAAADMTLEGALQRALGEAVERYCLYTRSAGRCVGIRQCVCSELRRESKKLLEDLVPYDGGQYVAGQIPFAKPDAECLCPWIQGTRSTGEQVWMPAGWVFGAGPAHRYPVVREITSNGVAAGLTLNAAIQAAAYELIERDTFLSTWYLGLPMRRIVFGSHLWTHDPLLCKMARFESDVMGFALEAGWNVHVLLCLVAARAGDEAFRIVGIGCSAHEHFGAAVRKAILEAFQIRHLMRVATDTKRSEELGSDWSQIRSPLDHLLLYQHPPFAHRILDWAQTASAQPITVDGSSLDETSVGSRVVHVPDYVYWDITTPDIAELGLRVVRLDVPGTVPLHIDQRWLPLGALRRRAKSLNVNCPDVGGLFPHPFA